MLKTLLPENFGFNQLVLGKYGLVLYNKNDIVVGHSALYYGEYFASETSVFEQIVKPGWHVADIGANIGMHTQALSRIVGQDGWVYAFEPQRLVFQTLCANMANNSIKNVDCERLGLGDYNGKIRVEEADPEQRNNFGSMQLGHSQSIGHVNIMCLDSYLDGRPLHFMKADIEGMEEACLRGAQKTLTKFDTILYLENEDPEKSPALLELLKTMGYDIYWHLPPFYNPNNFAGEESNIYGVGYVDDSEKYFGTIGFATNVICIPSRLNANVGGIGFMRVEDVNEHPRIKEKNRFHVD